MGEQGKTKDDLHPAIGEMAEREYFHLQRAAEIEKKIASIQHSTRSDISSLSYVHNYLRMTCRWYYNWHLQDWANLLHYFILVVYLAFWLWLISYK